MTKNYFAIERSGKGVDHVWMRRDDGTVAFEDVMNMSYEEIKSYEDIDSFVVCVMDMMNEHFGSSDEPTMVTLVGEDDVFIWGILIGPESNDEMRYAFVNWKENGKSYRYEKN